MKLRALIITASLVSFTLACPEVAPDGNEGEGEGEGEGEPSTSAVIGPEGGTLVSPDGALTLTVPADAVEGDTTFRITIDADAPTEGRLGPAYALEPAGVGFPFPVEVELRYGDDVDETNLTLLVLQDGATEWGLAVPVDIDAANNVIRSRRSHFSALSKGDRELVQALLGINAAEAPTTAFIAADGDDANSGISAGEPMATLGALLALTNGGEARVVGDRAIDYSGLRSIEIGPGSFTWPDDSKIATSHVSVVGSGAAQTTLVGFVLIGGLEQRAVLSDVTIDIASIRGNGGAERINAFQVSLDGAGSSLTASVVDGGGAEFVDGGGVSVFGDDVVIEGVTVRNADIGVALSGAQRATVRDSFIVDNVAGEGVGILRQSNATARIERTVVSRNNIGLRAVDGIDVAGGGNTFSCNLVVDVEGPPNDPYDADGNFWDHVPPLQLADGDPLVNDRSGNVSALDAELAPAPRCSSLPPANIALACEAPPPEEQLLVGDAVPVTCTVENQEASVFDQIELVIALGSDSAVIVPAETAPGCSSEGDQTIACVFTLAAAGDQGSTVDVPFTVEASQPTTWDIDATLTGPAPLLNATVSFTREVLALESVRVVPPSVQLLVGASRQMTAIGTLSDGSELDITGREGTSWTSADTSVATMFNLAGNPQHGTVVGQSAGSTTGLFFETDTAVNASFDIEVVDQLLANGEQCLSADVCQSGACADGVCCDETCDTICRTCTAQGFEGTCVVVADGGNDDTCQVPAFCNSGVCFLEGGANGTACQGDDECASTFCIDGVCCGGPCPDLCSACNVPGSEGTCSFVLAGQPDADSGCSGAAEACDGGGQCKKALGLVCASGDECASGFCPDGNCCVSACDGTCQGCANSAGECRLTLNNFPDNDTCFDDDRCDGAGNCKRGNGDPCINNSDCRFGNCVRENGEPEGVCCNTLCADDCESCRFADTGFPDGECQPVGDETDPYGDCEALPGRLCRGGACAAHIGDPCNATLVCGTNAGVCLSGFCCNSTQCGEFSGSACNSCANLETGAPNGTCAPVRPGPDPYGECASGQCAEGGVCVPP